MFKTILSFTTPSRLTIATIHVTVTEIKSKTFFKLNNLQIVKKDIKTVVAKAVLSPETKDNNKTKSKIGKINGLYFSLINRSNITKAKYFEIKLPKISSFPNKPLTL